MSEKKISVLIPDLSLHGTTRGYTISQGLQKLGYQVNIYGFLFGGEIYPSPPYGLPITYFHGKPLPSLVKTMFDLSGEIDGDILYVIKPQLSSFGVGLIKAWRGKKPLILDLDDWEMGEWGGDDWQYQGQIFHDVFSQDSDLRKPGHPLYLKWLEKAMNRVGGITVSSKFLEYRYGGTYLPNVRDTQVFNPDNFNGEKLREKYGLNNYKLLMVTSTCKAGQGIEDILTALDQLNNPQLRLILVGGNPENKDYYQQLQEKWGKWIITIQPQSFDQIQNAIALSHIMMITPHNLPANIAKCPLELIEAMAMAKPIIATKVGEIPHILSDTGYLINPQSPAEIAQQISLLFSDYEEAQQRGKLARQRCENYYSINNLTHTLAQVLSFI
ncbi:glycosyltransferase [Cyanobacterium aponinum UTEX 3222]|uniref:glycosyltransferase n=1 Tax=Cyanobacterium aponinum TaxID=379064 RepID=UPI002B4C0FC8|nr:glycosyltransferase [Cyanobacterium aponinum]WRL37859.1 glycosyltransferase [Cyanobacterium aponinum UTEX 3221]WRL41661.1 glycosyltransferase [Cyanobacterium aponinum UTEX 3222]